MKSFSSQINQRVPTMTVGEMLNGKYDDVHKQMYNHALLEYCSYAGIDTTDYRFIDLPGSYYDTPSRVQVIQKSFPYRRTVVDLTPFWESYKYKGMSSYMLIDDYTVSTSEVKYRDFVRGYAQLESRLTGVKYKVSLKDAPVDAESYPDDNQFDTSFTVKVDNEIEGL